MKLSDYGIDKEEEFRLYYMCRNLSEGQRDILIASARKVCDPAMVMPIVLSLEEGLSFNKMDQREYVPAARNYFFGYRRKVLAEFYKRLKEEGLWKENTNC